MRLACAVFAFSSFSKCFCTPPAYFGQVCRAEGSNPLQIFYKNSGEHQCCCRGEEGSVPGGSTGLAPALSNCNCKRIKQSAGPCSRKPSTNSRASTNMRKLRASHGNRGKKRKDVGHEEVGGNGWGTLAAFMLGLIPQTYNKSIRSLYSSSLCTKIFSIII